ncbi:non-heme iron oxygenase ferredoxin subunit [Solicola sp. PLA-1-18]|uniref:non-heme iron oxygenase ferredoxin subunit n=1 Tax=Solicola sp. PLA-1-18 TaxID=3380532 RepID=UPI003B79E269
MAFVQAATLAEVTEGKALGIEVDGIDIALVRSGDDVYAVADECSHAEVPLSDGDVEGCEIECYLHGSRFDVRTGEALNLPATAPVATYPCKVDGDAVLVDPAGASL